jgi:hypothetical protein
LETVLATDDAADLIGAGTAAATFFATSTVFFTASFTGAGVYCTTFSAAALTKATGALTTFFATLCTVLIAGVATALTAAPSAFKGFLSDGNRAAVRISWCEASIATSGLVVGFLSACEGSNGARKSINAESTNRTLTPRGLLSVFIPLTVRRGGAVCHSYASVLAQRHRLPGWANR